MKNTLILLPFIFFNTTVGANKLWNVIPIVNVDSFKNPIRCGYLYESLADKIVLKFEKYVVNNHVITSFSVKSSSIRENDEISLLTNTIDTNKKFVTRDFKNEEFTVTANLEESNVGGNLFYELAIYGGILKINNLEFKLPSKLSREVTALYLNCAGDLIRPDNEIR